MGVKVTFLGDEPLNPQKPALTVPAKALQDDGGKKVVFVYRDGHVERRAVSTGASRGSDLEIIAGLSDGDQVVINGFQGLHDGESVTLKQ